MIYSENWSLYMVPIGVTAACILLYVWHGLYMSYLRRHRVSRESSGGALDTKQIKFVSLGRENWGWSSVYAGALLLLAIFAFTIGQSPLSDKRVPSTQIVASEHLGMPAERVAPGLYAGGKPSDPQSLSANETSVWAMNEILREENRWLKQKLETSQKADKGAAPAGRWN